MHKAIDCESECDGLRVLSVFPGRTASPMQAAVHERSKAYHPEHLMQPQDKVAVINALSLPQVPEVTDISIRPFETLNHQ